MPFNKKQLTDGIFAGLGSEIPDDDDATKEMVMGISAKIADAIQLNPANLALENEEKINLLESRVQDLEAKVEGMQNFIDSLDARVETVEQKAGGAQAP